MILICIAVSIALAAGALIVRRHTSDPSHIRIPREHQAAMARKVNRILAEEAARVYAEEMQAR